MEGKLGKVCLWDEVKEWVRKGGSLVCGGEEEGLCIGGCVGVEGDIVVMDEGSCGVEGIGRKEIEGLMEEVKKEVSMVIVSDNM